MKRKNKIIWISVVIIIASINIVLYVTGKTYYYKALLYNYVDIDDQDLFPVREIKAGKAMPWNIAVDYNKTALPDTLLKTLEKYKSVAFLVIKNDSILHEQYWEGYGKKSHSNSFSMGKSFMSTLIGIAIDKGDIKNVNQSVCEFIPEFCSEGKEKITIKHLLTMSSGLDWNEGYSSLTSAVTQLYYDTDLPGQMYQIDVATAPGVEWNYMSCNTQILGMILMKATGESISSFASENLWQKIGAEYDAFWSLDEEDGIEKVYCCWYSNARDFARLGKLYMQDGSWNGNRVLSEGYVHDAITPADIDFSTMPKTRYGYQWWLTNRKGYKIFYARGILGQYIISIPKLNIIIVRLGHERGEKNKNMELPDVNVYIDSVIEKFG
jgi:CubicO group peptidase (beta-lactamase class C family)